MHSYKIIIATLPDEDGLVAEIWFDFHLATLFFREGELKVEFYHQGNRVLRLKEVTAPIDAAKSKLLSYKRVDNES